jgi:hypothetical protein
MTPRNVSVYSVSVTVSADWPTARVIGVRRLVRLVSALCVTAVRLPTRTYVRIYWCPLSVYGCGGGRG